MKKLTVLKAEVGQELEVVTIDNKLEELQKLVGGYIETVRIAEDILLVIDEEGRLAGKERNFIAVRVENNQIVPLTDIVGNGFFISWAGDDFVSLDKEQIAQIKEMFRVGRNLCIVEQI